MLFRSTLFTSALSILDSFLLGILSMADLLSSTSLPSTNVATSPFCLSNIFSLIITEFFENAKGGQ